MRSCSVILIVLTFLASGSAGATPTETFACEGAIVGGQVTATAELQFIDFPDFNLKLIFENGTETATVEGRGKYSYSQDVSTGEVQHIYQIRTHEGRGQISITKDSNGVETKIIAGGLIDKITPYVFAIRCQRN